MRLFLDECLSPRLVLELARTGEHYCIHPRDGGGLGDPDHVVLKRCLAEDLTIVTQNAGDFRALVARTDIHPGLILLPCVDRHRSLDLLRAAIAFLAERGDPQNVIVNHVLEVDIDGSSRLYELPAGGI
ncbi:putative nuclease of putative toxin-antitoxin system [Rhodobium orientis]|uniref:DUF5615 domain-containing protein n=1 Tax=Rhodobium orientis TaxID=34017 RepID=A0A327JW24_9HYPH|nr:DUF5615 family PIN-like protein [Rhodobium orientis]MBB4304893.1 putative nuclease of putative toxin-antitoxin system [Rhodobium orientis]MBK5949222.1 hypothetical protein [Rhodobium orientis]RAI27388.1 hypothetical protein CH339_10660 [Rhodobium orientis]